MMNVLYRQKTGKNHPACQDCYKIHQDEDRLIIAVADGNGAPCYTRSRFGARIACHAAVSLLRDGIAPEEFPTALKDCFDRLVCKHLQLRPLAPRELELLEGDPPCRVYGTTLLAACLTEDGARLFQLGDGEFYCLDSSGSVLPAMPDDDNCRGSLTTSLVQNRDFVLSRFRSQYYPQCTALMAFTDGFTGAWKAAEGLKDPDTLGEHIDTVLRKGEIGDDQTFVMAYQPAQVAGSDFQEGLRATTEAARADEKRQKRLQRLYEEFMELDTYLQLADQNLERMAARGDPKYEAYQLSLLPSCRRYKELQALLTAG